MTPEAQEIERLQAESEGWRKALMEVGEERRKEWQRAESAEAESEGWRKALMEALKREIASMKAPQKISAKTLYQRLVGELLEHWQDLYPMVEWVDPESSARVMAREVVALRAQLAAERARFDWWLGPAAKDINEYLRGMREGWSVEQWRAWIDAARSEASAKEGA